MQQLLPLVLLFAVMYFVLIRPQQQRVKAQRELVSSLVVGDEVVTIGGLVGEIVSINSEFATIETTPGVILRYRRTAISGKVGPPGDPEPPSEPAIDPPAGDA